MSIDKIPKDWGPNFRVHGFRGSQIGDSIAALCLAAWIRERAPGCHTIWQIARKHVHALPLFYNNPLITELSVSDCDEGYGPRDVAQAQTCHLCFPLMPEHTPGEVWPNFRSFYAETFKMSGLDESLYHEMRSYDRRPKLTQWFEIEKKTKTIAYWPCAAYGQVQTLTIDGKRVVKSRNASRTWAAGLVMRLKSEGYTVIQCGHPRDYSDCGGALEGALDARHISFMDMIKLSIGCSLSIGTDSGAGIALGAYGIPQISLLTNHFPGHTVNLTAFQPDNPNNISLVGLDSADNITYDQVMDSVKALISS